MNPFFNRFGGQNPPNNPISNMQGMLDQFNQFRAQFRGDPKQQVEQLLASGKMTQEEFNQLSQMASQLQRMFGKR